MSGFKDRTYCASPNCNNECGRRMSAEDKEYLKELAFRGVKASAMVSYAYFCGEEEEKKVNNNIE